MRVSGRDRINTLLAGIFGDHQVYCDYWSRQVGYQNRGPDYELLFITYSGTCLHTLVLDKHGYGDYFYDANEQQILEAIEQVKLEVLK